MRIPLAVLSVALVAQHAAVVAQANARSGALQQAADFLSAALLVVVMLVAVRWLLLVMPESLLTAPQRRVVALVAATALAVVNALLALLTSNILVFTGWL